MSMPLSPTRLFTCDGCGATLPVDEKKVGKRVRCGRCQKVLVVPRDEEDLFAEPPVGKKPEPRYIGFFCRVCDTRMVAREEATGRKTRCPDCGAITRVPPPELPKPKQLPRAMHGQQYALWDSELAPSGKELVARQPKYFSMYCHVCDTLMYAHPGQIGKKLQCPDCGAKTPVLPPPEEKEKKSALVPDGEEYQLDDTAAPAPRPVARIPAVREWEKHQQATDAIRQAFHQRPKMPKLPTVQGVLKMLPTSNLPAWWIGLSAGLTGLAWLGVNVVESFGGGFAAIFGVCCLAAACILGPLWFAAAGALWCSIIAESSEGHDRLYNPPTNNFTEWFGEAAYIGVPLAVSFAPGWAIGKLVELELLLMPLGVWLVFPILHLASLEQSSPMAVVSGKVWGSLALRGGHWLLFYLQSMLLVAAAVGAFWGVSETAFVLPAGSLIVVGFSLLYFRLLGRFAWWLAESLPEEDDVTFTDR